MGQLFGVKKEAWRYDGGRRDLLVGANGVSTKCHPIDQEMMIGLCTKQGSWKSDPTIGSTLHSIVYLGTPNLQAEVEDHVRKANPIAALLANGDVEIDLITHETTPGGALLVAVHYRNMRLDKNRVQRISTYT